MTAQDVTQHAAIIERLLLNRNIVGTCWIWTGTVLPNGYGEVRLFGQTFLVHRLSCFVYHDLDLNDKTKLALHKNICHNRLCFNPDHLYIGSNSDNIKDSIKLGNHKEKRKTHCPQGHEYTKENTHKNWKGHRQCKLCQKLHNKKACDKRRKNTK